MRAMARPQLPPAEQMKLVPLADIARGGMGSVQLARAEGGRLHGRPLAIKRLHASIAADPQFVGMFFDEAWMTAALRSPNVVEVAAWGEDEHGMFLAVELVQGVSLLRLMKEARQNQEPFAERTVAYLGSQLCAGMAAAHDLRGQDGRPLGLVHRDLTPGNILVGFDGVVKIADFGIAKAEERITHTRTGTLKGKPAYMAPEQARGGHVDGRADLFSLGVMLYELLAGRRPWTAKGTFEVMMEIGEKEPPALASLRPGVNPVFVHVVERCLQKNPERRFGDALEVQALLDEWRRGKGFDGDDRQSLEGFVRRNAQRQIAWFEKALRGQMARPDAPTFKELEEHLDRARKLAPSGELPAQRSGVGSAAIDEARAALRSLTAKPPRPAAGRASAGPPPPPPSRPRAPARAGADLGRTMAVDAEDIEVVGEANDLARTAYQPRFAEQPYAAVPAQALGQGAPHGTTEALARPVIAGVPVIAIGSATSGEGDLDRTTYMDRGVAPAAPPASGADTVALDDRAAWSAFALPSPAPPSPRPSANAPVSAAVSTARPRGRGGLVLLMVLGLLLGAAVVSFFLRGPIVRALSPAPTTGP
jgi:serine/threonine protein kinase